MVQFGEVAGDRGLCQISQEGIVLRCEFETPMYRWLSNLVDLENKYTGSKFLSSSQQEN